MNRIFFILLLFTISAFSLEGQKKDNVLFSVDGQPVNFSEFNYIYTKTNADKADYSKASVDEYLDLYKKFKLKVRRAKEMRLDTVPSLITELEGYRRQLADSYLIDKEVTDKLITELYERTQQDVNISHIMITAGAKASPADTLAALQKAKDALAKLEKGSSWEDVAMEYSDDRSKEKNKGNIGYITAMFPNGFYALENAAYTLPIGKTSKILRTGAGYHLVKVNERRPARGEMEVGHILARFKTPEEEAKAKAKIDDLYQKLLAGNAFDELAKAESEDRQSATKGGYIGVFGINQYEPAFENAAFGLKNNGDYTKPVKSSIGWHIIQRVSKKGVQPLKIVKSGLQNKIKKDSRFGLAQQAMVARIQKDAKFKETPGVLSHYVSHLDSNFLTFKWKPTGHDADKVLFNLGGTDNSTVADFEKFLSESSRERIRAAGSGTNEKIARELYNDFINKQCLGYEEKHLEDKYPDFKALMREYEEGILLFEATKIEVWDKASQDTVGLANFFNTVKGKYKWERRAAVSMYNVKTDNIEDTKDLVNAVIEFSKTNSSDKVLAEFNKDGKTNVTVIDRTFERGRNNVLDKMSWEVGEISALEVNKRNNAMNFMKIEEILEPGDKTLSEARGYVVADYQDLLEKQWIADLEKRFPIKMNKKTYKKMLKNKGEF